jgi:nitroreductase
MNNYDQYLEWIRSRRSIRRFSDRPVSRDDLLRLFAAASWAPSNHNRQPWRFIVFEEKADLVKLAGIVERGLSEKLPTLPAVASGFAGELMHCATFFSGAPVLILALHRLPVSVSQALLEGLEQPELVSGEPLSVAMAVQNLLLAAEPLGLGTCVLTAPLIVREAVSSATKLPAGYGLTCFVAVGYPAEAPLPPRRKSIEQFVEFRKNCI